MRKTKNLDSFEDFDSDESIGGSDCRILVNPVELVQ